MPNTVCNIYDYRNKNWTSCVSLDNRCVTDYSQWCLTLTTHTKLAAATGQHCPWHPPNSRDTASVPGRRWLLASPPRSVTSAGRATSSRGVPCLRACVHPHPAVALLLEVPRPAPADSRQSWASLRTPSDQHCSIGSDFNMKFNVILYNYSVPKLYLETHPLIILMGKVCFGWVEIWVQN